MLKAVFLPTTENLELQQVLKAEYLKPSYSVFTHEVLTILNIHPVIQRPIANAVIDTILFVINKIILDNVYRHVNGNSGNVLIQQLSNGNFSKDLYIHPFYLSQILEEAHINVEDKTELENLLSKGIFRYLDYIYTSNLEAFNIAILKVYEMLSIRASSLRVFSYRFELVDYKQPILIFTQRSANANHRSHELVHQNHSQQFGHR